jgi:DME family drug/metabolite transporter
MVFGFTAAGEREHMMDAVDQAILRPRSRCVPCATAGGVGTRLPRRWIAGTACAIAGCVLIAAPHGAGPAGQAHADVYGIACGVVAGGCFGVYTVSAKLLIRDNVNMQAAVPVTLLLGGAALAPWTLSELPELAAPRSAGT